MELNSRIRNILKDPASYLGIPGFLIWFLRSSHNTLFLIFVYHRVTNPLHNYQYIGVSMDVFEEHMRYIKNYFKVVSMAEGLRLLSEDNSEGIYAAVNFDDGYMDNYQYAFPILKRYEIPATIFLATDFIEKEHIFWWDVVFQAISFSKPGDISIVIDSESINFNLDGMARRGKAIDRINRILANKEEGVRQDFIKTLENKFPEAKDVGPRKMLGWKEIREMHAGGINFGSHTKTHRNLCLLKDHEVVEELKGSKEAIEKGLGSRVTEFSYPFGIMDARVKGLVAEAGYECARSGLKGLNLRNADSYELAYIAAGDVSKTSRLASRIAMTFLKTRQRGINEKDIVY